MLCAVVIIQLNYTHVIIDLDRCKMKNGNQLTLLTATSDDVLQEGVLRGHEAPPSSRHHYFDTVNFRNFGGYTEPLRSAKCHHRGVPFSLFIDKIKGDV